jgi:hypothetical protein
MGPKATTTMQGRKQEAIERTRFFPLLAVINVTSAYIKTSCNRAKWEVCRLSTSSRKSRHRHGNNAYRYCAVKFICTKRDRVEWGFLENMLIRLGFHQDFVQLLMACVSSVKYKVRYNDQETQEFLPTRGLRQGDPLSPYLLLIRRIIKLIGS